MPTITCNNTTLVTSSGLWWQEVEVEQALCRVASCLAVACEWIEARTKLSRGGSLSLCLSEREEQRSAVTARKEEPYLVQRLPLPGDHRRRRRQQRQPPTRERPREHGGRSCANEAAAVVTVIVFQMGRARLMARGTTLKSTTLARP
jgi:hypothetical protein